MSNEHPPSNSPAARPSDPTPQASESPQPWIRRQRTRVILLILVLGIIVFEAPREISRWYLAAAEVAFEEGDADAAGRYLDSALAWDKNSKEMKREFVHFLDIWCSPSGVILSSTSVVSK